MVFDLNRLKCAGIRNDGADGHDLNYPVGFCVDDSEFAMGTIPCYNCSKR